MPAGCGRARQGAARHRQGLRGGRVVRGGGPRVVRGGGARPNVTTVSERQKGGSKRESV